MLSFREHHRADQQWVKKRKAMEFARLENMVPLSHNEFQGPKDGAHVLMSD